jgi:hypothetical protein
MQESLSAKAEAGTAAGEAAFPLLDFEALSEHLAARLIYVVGNARGGSTFTNAAIGIHPEILCVGWNDIVLGKISPRLRSLDPGSLRRCMLRPDTGKHFNEAIAAQRIGEGNLRRWHLHVDRVCRSRDISRLLCLQALLYWIMHQPRADITSCVAWCIKENSWAGIEALKRAMPGARIVFVQRDPRSNSLSFAKVYARARQQRFTDSDLVRGALDWLRNATEFSIRFNRHPGSQLVHFEELVSDTPTVLNRLYGELGLTPLAPSAIRQALAGIEYTSTKTHEERGKPNPTGVHRESLIRWQRQLSPEQIALVGALTKAGADHYGYEVPPPRLRDIFSALRQLAIRPKAFLGYAYCRLRLLFLSKPPRSGAGTKP